MSDLAFNMNGEPFELLPTTAALRARKLKPKGAPEVVYGRDGLPLFLPIDADIEDLRREARADGRFRLDQVDEHHRSIPNAQSAYVCVHPLERTPEPPPQTPSLATVQADTTAALVAALLESQKQHTELARMYVSQFPVLANAMAGVVRSAGDVGLTARVPLVVPALPEPRPDESKRENDDEIDDDESDDDEGDDDEIGDELEPEPAYSWPRVAQTFAEYVGPHVGPLLAGIPGLGAMLGAQPSRSEPDAAPGPGQRDPAPADPASGGVAAGLDPSLAIRLRTILAQLTPAEQVFARSLLQEIPAEQMPGWIEQLRAMSVAEAVAYVRKLHGQARDAAATAPSAGPASTPPTATPSAAWTPRREAYRAATPRDMRRAHVPPSAARRSASTVAPSQDLPLLDSATQAHLAAIDRALTLEEGAAMRKHFGSLPASDRAGWVATLLTLPVADAVATIRAQVAGHAADARAGRGARAAQSSEKTARAAKTRDGSPTNLAASKPTTPPTKLGASPPAARNQPIVPTTTMPAPSMVPPAGAAATPPASTSLDGADSIAPATAAATAATQPPTVEPVETTIESASAMPHDVDRNAHTHLADVENALAPEERLLVHRMIAGLTPEDREAWLDQLLSVPAAQGAALLRDTLRELSMQGILVDAPSVNVAETLATEAYDDAPVIDETIDDRDDDQAQDGNQAQDDEQDDEGEERPDDAAHAAARTRSTIARSGALPTLDAASLAHFKAIEDALTFAEQMRVHELAAQRPAAELRRWYAELRALSVADAVAKVRAELARSHRDPNPSHDGGVS